MISIEFSKHCIPTIQTIKELIGVKISKTHKNYPYIFTYDSLRKQPQSGLPKNVRHYKREEHRERNFHLIEKRTYLFPTLFEAVEAVCWNFKDESFYPILIDDLLLFLSRMNEIAMRKSNLQVKPFRMGDLEICIHYVQSLWKPLPKNEAIEEESPVESSEGWIIRPDLSTLL